MKQKVAFIATCFNLILCLAFLAVCAHSSRAAMNNAATGELIRICRLSAEVMDSVAFDNTEQMQEALRQVSGAANVTATVFDPSGDAVFSSRSGAGDTLTDEELAGAQVNRVNSFIRNNQQTGTAYMYALTALENGSVICVSRAGYTVMEILGGNLVLLIMLTLLVGAASMIVLQVYISRSNRFVDEVQRVLEDFSEGRFDSRIKLQGDSLSQTAHFNEIMGRVQDRVFRQKTRNQALSTVMNHMQNGILAVDDQLNVILVTPAAKHLLGIIGSPEGLPIQQASKDVHLEGVLTEAMHQDGVYTNEVAARTAVGRGHRPLRLYVSPMMKDGKAVGAVAIVEDITELRRLEQVRTDFAANVSHELKTPLTSIKGFVETLQNGAINNPDMAQKFLRIIMLEADRLTRLINDILSITKLESGSEQLPSERIRLDQMADDVSDMLRILASEKQVTIYSHVNEEPSYIMGNPDRTEQMLINLIENAVKYNKPGGSVTVSVFNAQSSVNLSISDTGIGIAEEHLPRMFERFYRVDKGRSRSMGGTGLGLAIVKHIVRTMNGMIEVHSKVGEGTEFLITLPRVIPGDDDKNPFEHADGQNDEDKD